MQPSFEQTIAEYFANERVLIIDYFEQKGWKHKTTQSFCQIVMVNGDGESITIFPVTDLTENVKMKGSFYQENGIRADYILCIDASYEITYDFLFACNSNGTRTFKHS